MLILLLYSSVFTFMLMEAKTVHLKPAKTPKLVEHFGGSRFIINPHKYLVNMTRPCASWLLKGNWLRCNVLLHTEGLKWCVLQIQLNKTALFWSKALLTRYKFKCLSVLSFGNANFDADSSWIGTQQQSSPLRSVTLEQTNRCCQSQHQLVILTVDPAELCQQVQ